MIRKRFLAVVTLIFVVIFAIGCDGESPSSPPIIDNSNQSLIVDVIDVGQGDCILISLVGGATLMIDCGSGSKFSTQNIESVLSARNVDRIDYLVLTHPDSDHVGGTSFVASKCEIGRVFLPYLYYVDNFPVYSNAVNFLTEKGVNVAYSVSNLVLTDQDDNYLIKFLSPANKDIPESSYNNLNMVDPTDSQTNNVSPIIYVECQGVRMLFTGDAEKSQEEYVLSCYKSGLYGIDGSGVDLNNIDLLKVAHHGSKDSSSYEFLELLKPRNAVISVGGDNIYGHPTTSVLERLISANKNCNIYRTDYLGMITFTVKNGTFTKI